MKIKHPILLGFGLVVLYLLFWPSEKDHLNAQMAEMCMKDGGMKIYERVKLPPEDFSSGGVIKESNYKKISDTESIFLLADSFEVHRTVKRLKDGDPWRGEGTLERIYSTIIRLSDKKLIAESIHYSRSGGGDGMQGIPAQIVVH